jgi:four helix bundle protein
MPKEIRNPKSDIGHELDQAVRENSVVWNWGASHSANGFVLNETASGKEPAADLAERVAQFGERIIRLAKKIPRGAEHPENNRLVDQLVGAGTSIGANYSEADDAVSGKDFKNKIGISRKEFKETMFFLRMIAASEESLAEEARELWREAKELNLIFGSIWRK